MYVKIATQKEYATKPDRIDGTMTFNPTDAQLAEAGIFPYDGTVEPTPKGSMVTAYVYRFNFDGKTCGKYISASISVIEAQQAQADAAAASAIAATAQAEAQKEAKAAYYAEVVGVIVKVLNARPEFRDKPITEADVATAASEVVSAVSAKPIGEMEP